LKNEAKQKPRFLLCVLKKAMDGLFQQPARISNRNSPYLVLISIKSEADTPFTIVRLIMG